MVTYKEITGWGASMVPTPDEIVRRRVAAREERIQDLTEWLFEHVAAALCTPLSVDVSTAPTHNPDELDEMINRVVTAGWQCHKLVYEGRIAYIAIATSEEEFPAYML